MGRGRRKTCDDGMVGCDVVCLGGFEACADTCGGVSVFSIANSKGVLR